jgi:PAS domain S-box-containing protein
MNKNFTNDPSESQAMPGFEPILQVLHEGVYIVDKERRIQYRNTAAEAITGYSAETVLGRRRADKQRYASKKSGRNRVIVDA